jgi:hypothetical protein
MATPPTAMAAAPGIAMPVAVVPVLIVPMSVAVTAFPVAVTAMHTGVAAMVAAVMAATAMLGHGRAWDRQGCHNGCNKCEFSKHLLIPPR